MNFIALPQLWTEVQSVVNIMKKLCLLLAISSFLILDIVKCQEEGSGGAQGEIPILLDNEYLFIDNGVKKMKCTLRCHFQPRVTEGHEWLEMAPSVK